MIAISCFSDHETVYREVHAERTRAHYKHDLHGQSMERKSSSAPEWLPVLIEEVGEVARSMNYDTKGNLRDELVQVAAMACAWINSIDRSA